MEQYTSAGVYTGFMVVTATPTEAAPASSSGNSTQLGRKSAMTSPFLAPAETRLEPKLADWRRHSEKVSERPVMPSTCDKMFVSRA